ncbi:MAG: hypothetical protein WCC57_10290 [Paracoccaceae bacterium]
MAKNMTTPPAKANCVASDHVDHTFNRLVKLCFSPEFIAPPYKMPQQKKRTLVGKHPRLISNILTLSEIWWQIGGDNGTSQLNSAMNPAGP